MFNKKIFLSYSWSNIKIADKIDTDFRNFGINLTRDKRNLRYKDNLKEFMSKIREHDFVIVILTEEYLKSDNCLFELLQLFHSNEFENKILPIVMKNAKIFKLEDRKPYFDFWAEKINQIQIDLLKYQSLDFAEKLLELKNTQIHLPNIFLQITKLNTLFCNNEDELEQTYYKSILEKIGYNDDLFGQKLFEILDLADSDEGKLIGLENLIDEYPMTIPLQIVKGELQYRKKMFQQAINTYLKILKNDIGNNFNGAIYYNLALAYFEQKEYTTTKEYLNKAITINYITEDIYDLGCRVYIKENEVEKLLKYVQSATEIFPQSTRLRNNAGIYAINCKQYKLAEFFLLSAIEIDKSYFKAYHNLGIVYQNLEDIELAIKMFNNCIKLSKNHAASYYHLGNIYSESLDNFKMGKEYLEKAVLYDNSIDTYWANLGRCNLILGDDETAFECSQKAVEINNKRAEAWFTISVFWSKRKDKRFTLEALNNVFSNNLEKYKSIVRYDFYKWLFEDTDFLKLLYKFELDK